MDFAKLNFFQTAEVVQRTSLLMGMHGAGLVNTVFLPKGAGLLEMFYYGALQYQQEKRLHYEVFPSPIPPHYVAIEYRKSLGSRLQLSLQYFCCCKLLMPTLQKRVKDSCAIMCIGTWFFLLFAHIYSSCSC